MTHFETPFLRVLAKPVKSGRFLAESLKTAQNGSKKGSQKWSKNRHFLTLFGVLARGVKNQPVFG